MNVLLDELTRDVDECYREILRETLDGSPALTGRFIEAGHQGNVRSIEVMNMGADAAYDAGSRRLLIDRDGLETNCYHTTTFVLGHELQHAADGADDLDQRQALIMEAHEISASRGEHDYTGLLGKAIESTRSFEARAEITGWNTLVDTLRHEGSPLNLRSIYQACPGRMADFIDIEDGQIGAPEAYRLKRGIQTDNHMRMPMTEGNIKAMAGHYADRPLAPGLGFGAQQSADYRHMAATECLNMVIRVGNYGARNDRDNTPYLRIDLANLGLEPRRMQEHGVHLAGGRQALPIHDHSHSPFVEVNHFSQSGEGCHGNAFIRRPLPPLPYSRELPLPVEDSKRSRNVDVREQNVILKVARRIHDRPSRKR
jgi:hypothetical protein